MRRDLKTDQSPPFTQLSAGCVCQKPARCLLPHWFSVVHLADKTGSTCPLDHGILPQEPGSFPLDMPSPFLLGLSLLKGLFSERMCHVASTGLLMLITFRDEFLQQNQQDREVVHSFRREMFSFVYGARVTSILLTVQSNEQTCSIIA